MPLIPQKKEEEAVHWIGMSPPAGAFHYLIPQLSGSKGMGGEERKTGDRRLGLEESDPGLPFACLRAAAGGLLHLCCPGRDGSYSWTKDRSFRPHRPLRPHQALFKG